MFIASPTFLYFIAKNELKKMPFIGWAIWASGMVFIDRSDRNKAMRSMREAGEKAKHQKKNIVSFPEGTRSDGEMTQFKRGTFIIASQTNLDIIPTAIAGTNRIWPGNMWPIRPGIIKVKFGEPISPADHTDKTPEEFADYVQKIVADMKASIQ